MCYCIVHSILKILRVPVAQMLEYSFPRRVILTRSSVGVKLLFYFFCTKYLSGHPD
uniref:Uncharacterized protein n=1 Tax=Arion vulgaris TaxID=1028688 RepID=A0A0B7AR26_9EUPU